MDSLKFIIFVNLYFFFRFPSYFLVVLFGLLFSFAPFLFLNKFSITCQNKTQALFFGGEDKLPAFLARHTIPGLGVVVDPCAALLVLIVTVVLCTGIKEVGVLFHIYIYIICFWWVFLICFQKSIDLSEFIGTNDCYDS